MNISVVFRKNSWTLDATGKIESAKLFNELHRIQKKESRGRLYCRECGRFVAYERERIDMAGSHIHSFTNPHGQRYCIGCFSNAPGCLEIGQDTEEFTWFKGYAWRAVLCASCYGHLGWVFNSEKGNRFFGLILRQLLYPW